MLFRNISRMVFITTFKRTFIDDFSLLMVCGRRESNFIYLHKVI